MNQTTTETSAPAGAGRTMELLGWVGATAIVAMYFASSMELMKTGMLYQCINGAASVAVAAISIRKRAYQPAFINCVWALISIVAIVRLVRA